MTTVRSKRLSACILLALLLSGPWTASALAPAASVAENGLVLMGPEVRRPGPNTTVVYRTPNIVPDLSAQAEAPAASTALEGWQTIFQDGFEGSFPGAWDVREPNQSTEGYQWGKSVCRPYAGSYSAWATGGGPDGSQLACGSLYPHNLENWLVYGPFDLRGAAVAQLQWVMWLNSEERYDNLWWGASTDGEEFFILGASGDSEGWLDWTLDLRDVRGLGNLMGEARVWVCFIFASDDNTHAAEGAYVDNVRLRTGDSTVFRFQSMIPVAVQGYPPAE